MSVLPTEEKKDRAVLAQELVGPISTWIPQNFTKIFWTLGVLTNLPNVLPSPYPRPYSLGGCYILVWGGHNPARLDFCFELLVLLCLVELSCIPMLAQQPLVGFHWLPPNWRGSACHSWSWAWTGHAWESYWIFPRGQTFCFYKMLWARRDCNKSWLIYYVYLTLFCTVLSSVTAFMCPYTHLPKPFLLLPSLVRNHEIHHQKM